MGKPKEISCRRIVGGVLFLGTYVLLYFGLYGALVHYSHYLPLKDSYFKGEDKKKQLDELVTFTRIIGQDRIPVVPETTRSLFGDRGWDWSMVHLLLDKAEKGESGYLPPYALITFGVILPAIKFVSVAYWFLQTTYCPSLPGAGVMLNFAVRLSRWTAVDAVCEAIIVALLLKGGVHAEHQFGFVCFVAYCLMSSISIWVMDDSGESRGSSWFFKCIVSPCSFLCPAFTVVTLVAFLATFAFGATYYPLIIIRVPVHELNWQINQVVQPYRGALDLVYDDAKLTELIKEFVESIPLPAGESTVLGCAQTLLFSGHIYTVVGSVLLFTCAIICPIVEAVSACIVACSTPAALTIADLEHEANIIRSERDAIGDDEDYLLDTEAKPVRRQTNHHGCWSWILDASGDLAMLDVFVFGMYVASLVLSSLGDVLLAELLKGFYCLIPAAGLGVLHQMVCGAVALETCRRQDAVNDKRRQDMAESKEAAAEQKRKAQNSARKGVLGFACCASGTKPQYDTSPKNGRKPSAVTPR